MRSGQSSCRLLHMWIVQVSYITDTWINKQLTWQIEKVHIDHKVSVFSFADSNQNSSPFLICIGRACVFACNDLVFVELVHSKPKLSLCQDYWDFQSSCIDAHLHLLSNKTNPPTHHALKGAHHEVTTLISPRPCDLLLELHLKSQSWPHSHFPFHRCMSVENSQLYLPESQPPATNYPLPLHSDNESGSPPAIPNIQPSHKYSATKFRVFSVFYFSFLWFCKSGSFLLKWHNYTGKNIFPRFFYFKNHNIVKIHHQKEKKKELLLCYGKEGTVCISLLMCTT